MRVAVLSVVLIVTPALLWGQKRATAPLISRAHPSVYITFERQGQLKNLGGTGELRQTAWLRLHNNLRWSIVLDMNGVPSKAYGDASLFYDRIVGTDVVFQDRCHVCSFNPLTPGHSLVFTVPLQDLPARASIRVKFRYGWEHQSDDVEHFVYFYSSSLPTGAG
jgi:hypothetical protein